VQHAGDKGEIHAQERLIRRRFAAGRRRCVQKVLHLFQRHSINHNILNILSSVADPGCLSRIPDPTFSIPDPNCLHPGSRILIKEYKYFNTKKAKKWFLSSKKYDPGCSSRIPDPDAEFLPSRIPDPGVKKAPNPGSRIRIRNTDSQNRPVLWIRDILVRVRIRGSVPLTYGYGSGFFRQWLTRCQQKVSFLAYYFFKVHLHQHQS
jgi:hypothetical protein